MPFAASSKTKRGYPAASALTDLAPHANLFLRYQQGFRPGAIVIDGDDVRRFRNDRMATIEAGLRTGQPRQDSYELAVTVAHASGRDIQVDFIDPRVCRPPPTSATDGSGR